MPPSNSQTRGRSHALRAIATLTITIGTIGLPAAAIAAGPALAITPLEWNVVGLDSNSPASGPHRFHIGAKVCNTGDAAANDVQATWTWDTASAALALDGPSNIALPNLDPAECAVAYFGVTVAVANTSYNQARRFHISASATGAATVSTPTPREVYVEKLISQNRNSVTASSGPTSVYVGDTVTYAFSGTTASNYEQLAAMPYFDPSIFRIMSVGKTVQTGGASTQFYSDACGWVNDPTSPDYRGCSGTGKTGGDIAVTITVKVVGTGTTTISSLVDDFSGSSYHYNSDYSSSVYARTVVATNPPPPNTVPVAVDDAVSLDQDTSANVVVLGNDSDPDGDALSVTGASQPSHGITVLEADGSVTYTPTAGYSGPDSFTYTISDGNGVTATATVTVTVTPVVVPPVNTVPVAVDDAVSLDQDTSANVVVLGNDSDPDGDALSVTGASQPSHGTVVVEADGSVTYTPTAGYSGPDSFTYSISDGNGGTATATVVVTVTPAVVPPVNTVPVAVDDAVTLDQDTSANVVVLGNDSDPDGDVLVVTGATQPGHGTVLLNPDGSVTYTPTAGYSGPDAFTYTISDGHPGTPTATVSVTVLPRVVAPKTPVQVAPVAGVPIKFVPQVKTSKVLPTTKATAPLPATGAAPWTLAAGQFGLMLAFAGTWVVARSRRTRS